MRTKVPKARAKVKTSKSGLSGLKKLENRDKLGNSGICVFGFMMDEVLINGMMAGIVTNGVLLDGTKVGNKRMAKPQAHFRLED